MKLSKLLVSAVTSGALLFSGSAMAASGDGASNFKDAYLASPNDTRVFVNGANIVGPYFHADINGKGKILSDGSLAWNGKIEWVYTNKDTNSSANENIPIYLEQTSGAMTLYVNRKNQWVKFNLPGIPARVVSAIKTTDVSQLTKNMDAVKSAQIVENSGDTEKIRLTIDGKKAANLIRSGANNSSSEIFVNRIAKGLESSDVTVDWGINKSTRQTVTLTLNATPIISGYAKAILDEKFAGKITLTDAETRYYTVLGYYVNAPVYISIVGAQGETSVAAPANLGSARYNDNVFSDLKRQIVATPIK